jgi:hypothetical protein
MSTKMPASGFPPHNIGWMMYSVGTLASDMLFSISITEVNMSEARKYTEYRVQLPTC